MKDESKLFRSIFISPWFLLIFLVIPIIVILSLTLHVRIPLANARLLLGNNIFFTLLVACRLLWYFSCIRKGIRYGASYCRPRRSVNANLPVPEVRRMLTGAGFTFSADGGYGEKHDIGYFGTTVLYGGLLILLAVGSWDNLRQFAGVLLDSVGPATRLSRAESYRHLTLGSMATRLDSLPRMQIISQTLPDSAYPKGATEIALIPEDGKEQRAILKPTDPYRYGAYDIYMAKLVFEPEIVIKTKDSRTLFDNFVKLDPLVQKRGPFSFYGLFVGTEAVVGVYYQPEKSLMKVIITRDNKQVVTDLMFQVDQQVSQGDYVLSCAKMGQWSEIHVVHRRHKSLLWLGGIIAGIGLMMRIAIRPQRVWLEDADGGSRVTAVGKETRKLLN